MVVLVCRGDGVGSKLVADMRSAIASTRPQGAIDEGGPEAAVSSDGLPA